MSELLYVALALLVAPSLAEIVHALLGPWRDRRARLEMLRFERSTEFLDHRLMLLAQERGTTQAAIRAAFDVASDQRRRQEESDRANEG